MNPVEIIRKKRNGEELNKIEMQFIILGYTKGKIPDYQFASFLMAVYLKGMSVKETAIFTEVMLYSGEVIDLKKIDGVKIDKHSTGGVGDKTSLILAPIVAAAGVKVPMISGRGLGHTGGTLDKLESIPGFRTDLSLAEYKNVIKKCGAVLIGQTASIAPADKKIYALRDVTATVESIPLITASIMSKKLAEGIDGLILDVKTGNGAFMQSYSDSKKLALSLMNTAKSFDKKVVAFITDMNQPLGKYIGNWFEIYESIKVLQGEWIDDLCELSFTLSGAMIFLGGKAKSIEDGYEKSIELVKNGKAFDKFVEIVKLQKGDTSFIFDTSKYPKSKYSLKIKSNAAGFVNNINTYEIGVAAIELGAGRFTKEDVIDHKAGIIFHKKLQDKIEQDEVLAEIFTDKKNVLKDVESRIKNAISVSNKKGKKEKIIKEVLN
ncbi:MAG: thymidine phosphorylase [Chlorobiaceae bacterium]|nr:thymidine phosphorylase [Chlorobiaceae bacterium]MBA4309210.1 thymidine phosphorylase [Chlorobiaceae bacterium]